MQQCIGEFIQHWEIMEFCNHSHVCLIIEIDVLHIKPFLRYWLCVRKSLAPNWFGATLFQLYDVAIEEIIYV